MKLKIQNLKVKSFITKVGENNDLIGKGTQLCTAVPEICSGTCNPGSGEVTCDPNYSHQWTC